MTASILLIIHKLNPCQHHETFSEFSRNSEANASEFLENIDDVRVTTCIELPFMLYLKPDEITAKLRHRREI